MAIINFGCIFKHPHVARNVMLKVKKIDQTHFLSFCAPQKIKVDPCMPAIPNFSEILKKSPAHLHMVSNVIFAPTQFLELTSGGHFEFW